MTKKRAIYKITILVVLLLLCGSTIVSSSPMYGGDRPGVARELLTREREVHSTKVLLNVLELPGLVMSIIEY